MKTYTHPIELQHDYPSIFNHLEHICGDQEDFMTTIGGDVHVCESPEELLSVMGANDYFDVAAPCTENPEWFEMYVINNNSGGPSWFAPMSYLARPDTATLIIKE